MFGSNILLFINRIECALHVLVITSIAETKSCEGFRKSPANALAIASSGCGDQLVLLKQNNNYSDSVYNWLHVNGEIYKVANEGI